MIATVVSEVEPENECDQQLSAGLVLSDGSRLAEFGGRMVVGKGKWSCLQELHFLQVSLAVLEILLLKSVLLLLQTHCRQQITFLKVSVF